MEEKAIVTAVHTAATRRLGKGLEFNSLHVSFRIVGSSIYGPDGTSVITRDKDDRSFVPLRANLLREIESGTIRQLVVQHVGIKTFLFDGPASIRDRLGGLGLILFMEKHPASRFGRPRRRHLPLRCDCHWIRATEPTLPVEQWKRISPGGVSELPSCITFREWVWL
jgi:hypothetical protein